MACTTCDHTTHRVNSAEPGAFWCPRCGTIEIDGDVEAPKLVGRCREFDQDMQDAGLEGVRSLMKRRGIAEAINTPENRGGAS